MSVLWSKLMAAALVVCCCKPDLMCSYCGLITPLEKVMDVNALLTAAHHECPGAWDLLADHLVERTGTTGFTRNGVADPHNHVYMTPRERLLAILRKEEGWDSSGLSSAASSPASHSRTAHDTDDDRKADRTGGNVSQVRHTGTGWPAGPTRTQRPTNGGVYRPAVREVQVGREAEGELG